MQYDHIKKLLLIFILVGWGLCPLLAQVVYVDVDATSGGDGLSWPTAYTDLQDGLAHADTSASILEIWVAEGSYYPSSVGDRHEFFVMKNTLGIYGGFNGSEFNRQDRNWRLHETILSGDIDQNGILDSINSNHIFRNHFNGLDSTAILDGFTVSDGYAYQNAGFSSYRGGAMINREVQPTIRNCVFLNNYASNWGGAVYNDEAAVTFINCTFNGNVSGSNGGALNLFRANGVIINCVFTDNISSSSGGALYLNQSSPDVTNCSFFNNQASNGAAIRNFFSTAQASITNCILWNNQPDEIFSSSGANPTVTNCIIRGGFTGTNIWDVDPLFVDTAIRNLNILYGSPAINVGVNDSIPSLVDTDLAGNDRIINSQVDLGAYEFNYEFPCGKYDSLSVTESPIYPAIYKAGVQVSSLSTVTLLSSPVVFESGHEVLLEPLFEVDIGAEFTATVENPCVD